MLEQLDTHVLPSCKFIQLRYRYSISSSMVKMKIITFLIQIELHYKTVSIYRLLDSVKQNILNDIFYLQHEDVDWKTVSITFPYSRYGSTKDLLKLPLIDYRGLGCFPNADRYNLQVMHIGLRFAGRPLPKNVKIHGICPDETPHFHYVADSCANVYKSKLEIGDTGIMYKLIFESEDIKKTSKQQQSEKKQIQGNKKSQQNHKTSQKRQLNIIEPTICYWTLHNL